MGTTLDRFQRGPWSYDIPPEEDPTSAITTESDADQSVYPASQQLPSAHMNGNHQPNARRNDKATDSSDPSYPYSASLKPPAPIAEQNDISGTNSEADSLIDLYRANGNRSKSSSRGPAAMKRKGSLGAVSALSDNQNDLDVESKWIHRDKLAQIESQELAQLRLSHSGSKSKARLASKKSSVAPSVDLDPESVADGDRLHSESKRMRTLSPTHANEAVLEEDRYVTVPPSSSQPTQRSASASHVRRPSASKIPVTKSSTQADSSSPIQPASPQQRIARTRSGSQSNLYPDTPPTLSTAVPTASPTVSSPNSSQKKKLPGKTTPQSGQRKTSRGAKTGTSSRPGTSGGSSRPSTARPEGEAPWISSMYKPDPMLPPDQQMLPTHAKRLAQEQEFRDAMEHGKYSEPPQDSEYTLLDEDGDDGDDPNQEVENVTPTDITHPPPLPPPSQQQQQQQQSNGHEREQQQQNENIVQNDQNYSQQRDYPQVFPPHGVGYNSANGYQAAPSSPTNLDRNQAHNNEQSQPQPQASPTRKNNAREDPQWPLRSPAPTASQQQQRDSQNYHSDKEVFVQPAGRAGTPVLESGYSLMPPIQNQKEQEHVTSQRVGRSIPTPVIDTQQRVSATRVPDAPEHDEKIDNKKKGCASCCIVM